MPAGTTRQRRCGRERYFAGVSPRLFRRRPLETHHPRLGKVIPLETPVYGRQAVLAAGRNREADQKDDRCGHTAHPRIYFLLSEEGSEAHDVVSILWQANLCSRLGEFFFRDQVSARCPYQ